MIGRKCGLRAVIMPSSTAATVILQYSFRTHQRTSTYTPTTESPSVSTGMATPSGYSTKMTTRFMPIARPQETMVAAADSGPLICPPRSWRVARLYSLAGGPVLVSLQKAGGRDGEVFANVYERLRVFAGVFRRLWGRASGERPGRGFFDFQLIVLRIEGGGGPGRLESAGGRGAEGWRAGSDSKGRARV